jgi:anaphase-promoting complex subunit 6
VDESGVDESLGEMEEEEGGMVERMRNWRNDAMTQHLYGTAEFWGGKVFGMTGELQLQLESGDWS